VCEWDPAKAEANIAEHGVDFADAEIVFDNPYLHVEDTDAAGEQRFNALGMDGQGRLLVVTYTYREDKKRIISAKKANGKQRRQYAKRMRLQ
jgi:uncharacterized protein